MQKDHSGQSDLSIIILNYNGRLWLEKLLPSLRKNYLERSGYFVDVVVVDNDSSDDSIDYIRSLEWIKLIETGKNGGYAFGNNVALKEAKARYVMLLNSDTEIPETGGDLDLLIRYMDGNENAGIITPRLNLENGAMDPACHRGEPTPWASIAYFLKLEKLFSKSETFAKYHQKYKNLKEIHTIDACTGAAMLVRKSAMDKVGLLDERFFMYAEDLDWCKRFRENGFNIIFYPDVNIIHHKYKSGILNRDDEMRSKTRVWFYNTMLLYYDKHYASSYPKFFRWFLKTCIKRKTGNQGNN